MASGSIVNCFAILNDCMKDFKEEGRKIALLIINPKYHEEMLKHGGFTSKMCEGFGLKMYYQMYNDIPAVISPFVEDWFIVPDIHWYEQKIEAKPKLEQR